MNAESTDAARDSPTDASRDSLTDVPGIRVGHARAAGGGSGCTVVLGPFRGGVHVTGIATGSRELRTLDPRHLVPRVDAVLLTGGSAFGLAAADGVMGWLAERGEGYQAGTARVPIVPAAVLYDLQEGRGRPGAEEGRTACGQATDGPVRQGRVGAGSGATVGKVLGRERASPGGLGSASVRLGEWVVGALAAVNAFGDVLGRDGRVVAGARTDDDGFADSTAVLLAAREPGAKDPFQPPPAGTNTTLAVVATDAPLSRVDLVRVAGMAAAGLARRIAPVHTPFDGDVTFALSTAASVEELDPGLLLSLGVAAREALETAVLRAVAT